MGQPTIPPLPPSLDFAGQTIIITGGNAGLGFNAAEQFLVRKAARVILAVRSRARGEEAVAALKANTAIKRANPGAKIEVMELDLDDFESGLAFVKRVKSELKELDILLCNGGVILTNYQVSKAGHERSMQVNCYSHFLIILELLPLLRSTAAMRGSPSRVTFVGSGMQLKHSLSKQPISSSSTVYGHFDDRDMYSVFTRYSDSKLAVNAFCRELATHVSASEVLVNNVCPGAVATGLDKNLWFWIKPVVILWRKAVARSPEEGGRTLIFAAGIAGPKQHGKFLQNNEVSIGAPFLDEAAGKEFVQRLWSETIAMVSHLDPEFKLAA